MSWRWRFSAWSAFPPLRFVRSNFAFASCDMLASRIANLRFCWFKRPCPLGKKSGNVLYLCESRRAYTRKSDRLRVELKDKKSIDCEKMRGKESFANDKGKASIALVGDGGDIDRLKAMTVKELREMMREAGIPAKGTKADLVAALTSFLRSTCQVEDMPATVQQPVSKKSSSKRKLDDSEGSSNDFPSKNSDDNKCSRYQSKSSAIEESSSIYAGNAATVKSTPRTKTMKVEEKSIKSLVSNEPWTVLVHKKPQDGWMAYNPKVMRPCPLPDDAKAIKLISWNVNGLRGLLKSEASSVLQLAEKQNFDVLCLQETKMQEKDVEKIKERLIDGYDHNYWTCSISKLGYSGTAILSRIKPISVSYGLGIADHDSEGRLVTVEFDNFYLLCAYVPNSGDGLKRLEYRIKEWDPSLSNYMKDLEKSKPVILTGDLNCAHEEIDIHNPAGNRRSAGFTDEERESFRKNFVSRGFVDTFRKQHPSVVGYTYYGYRHGGRKSNKGWRLDYFLVSELISDKVHDSYIVPDVSGSDHCPIGLILKL